MLSSDSQRKPLEKQYLNRNGNKSFKQIRVVQTSEKSGSLSKVAVRAHVVV